MFLKYFCFLVRTSCCKYFIPILFSQPITIQLYTRVCKGPVLHYTVQPSGTLKDTADGLHYDY